jgi:DUF4097 and DUF4098 domain-containing protein YvlB
MPEFPCSGPIKVEIDVPAGRVSVTTEDCETALVEVKPFGDRDRDRATAEATEVSFDGDTLTVEAPDNSGWLSWRSGSIRVDVRVPVDSSARIKTASAGITCRGRYTQVEVKSASGDVSLDDAAGDVKVQTASGEIVVGNIGGQLSAATASGDIKAGKVQGAANLKTASGDIKIDAAAGDVQVKSASGDLEVGAASRGEVSVRSVSGRVSIGVVSGTGVWMDLSSLSGRVESALESVDSPPERQDLTVQVHTVSGDIGITRSRQPAEALSGDRD